MFRTNKYKLPFEPSNGQQVVVRAQVSLYEPRGDLQLVVEHMEEAGFGALQRQYEALKKKLHSEGLFASDNKQALPFCPANIAIITSASSAALQDFLKVCQRRYPNCTKTIYAVPVQGDTVAPAMTQALEFINHQDQVDVIAIIRGGGSIEDLWAFNDEQLAHAIVGSKIPIVTGIGHEIDFTIADFVADVRAPTPSVAAELICPEQTAVQQTFDHLLIQLRQLLVNQFNTKTQSLDWINRRLSQRDPAKQISQHKNSLKQINQRLAHTMVTRFSLKQTSLAILTHRLERETPKKQLEKSHKSLVEVSKSLHQQISQRIQQSQHRLQLSANSMHMISPLNTLKRGYSITTTDQTQVVTHNQQVEPGQCLITHFSQGQIISRVESTSSTNLIPELANNRQEDESDNLQQAKQSDN